jgi:hypothetical protein
MLDPSKQMFVRPRKEPEVGLDVSRRCLAPQIPAIGLDPVEERGGHLHRRFELRRSEILDQHGRGRAILAAHVGEGCHQALVPKRVMIHHHLHRVARRHRVIPDRGLGVDQGQQIVLVEHHLAHRDDGEPQHLHQGEILRSPNDPAVDDTCFHAGTLLEEESQRHRRGETVGVGIVVGQDQRTLSPPGQPQQLVELGPDGELAERALRTRRLLGLGTGRGG